MKDGEARGLVLARFYDARHKIDWLSLEALRTHLVMDQTQMANVCEQLSQHGLIVFEALRGDGGIVAGMGRITASGVDVIEGNLRSPIAITFHDQSVTVTGSSHVQIGNSNVSTTNVDIGKLIAAIDRSTASDGEKTEAKSLIEKITSNPLVVAVLGSVLGSGAAH
jgi:hypothetical protein